MLKVHKLPMYNFYCLNSRDIKRIFVMCSSGSSTSVVQVPKRFTSVIATSIWFLTTFLVFNTSILEDCYIS